MCVALAYTSVVIYYSSKRKLIQTFVIVAAVVCSKFRGDNTAHPQSHPISLATCKFTCRVNTSPPVTGLRLPLLSPVPNHAWTPQNTTESYHCCLKPAHGFQGRGLRAMCSQPPPPISPASPVPLSTSHSIPVTLGFCCSTNAPNSLLPQDLCTCNISSPQGSALLLCHTLVLTISVTPQRGFLAPLPTSRSDHLG